MRQNILHLPETRRSPSQPGNSSSSGSRSSRRSSGSSRILVTEMLMPNVIMGENPAIPIAAIKHIIAVEAAIVGSSKIK